MTTEEAIRYVRGIERARNLVRPVPSMLETIASLDHVFPDSPELTAAAAKLTEFVEHAEAFVLYLDAAFDVEHGDAFEFGDGGEPS